jgi:hypothetical protein
MSDKVAITGGSEADVKSPSPEFRQAVAKWNSVTKQAMANPASADAKLLQPFFGSEQLNYKQVPGNWE